MKSEVLKVLQQVDPEIAEGIHLIDAGIIDSFEVVNIVMELEEEFDIEIDADYVVPENFETVDKIVALVEKIKS